ncbi:MAG: CHRD domain-containing protein [Sphingorhabdus sp.]
MDQHKKIMLVLIASTGIAVLGACATVEEGVAEAVAETHRAELNGSQIVGSSRDQDGYARAELTISDEANQICYDINEVRNLGTITGATINRGGRGSNGSVVMRLREANEGGWKNCVGRTEWLEDRIERNPSAYYVVINTSEYPNGAIRGQFMAS